jgi:hypothetical protein
MPPAAPFLLTVRFLLAARRLLLLLDALTFPTRTSPPRSRASGSPPAPGASLRLPRRTEGFRVEELGAAELLVPGLSTRLRERELLSPLLLRRLRAAPVDGLAALPRLSLQMTIFPDVTSCGRRINSSDL